MVKVFYVSSEGFSFFFVFDDILDKSLKERRDILGQHMTPIENRILLSDLKIINKKSELKHLINFAIAEGLEGLVLKVNISAIDLLSSVELRRSIFV
jgi:ATP-dependent DNA ligase